MVDNSPIFNYAFIQDGVVKNIFVFSKKNDPFIETLKLEHNITEVIDCEEFLGAEVGGTWDGTQFYPIKPFKNFIWDDTKNAWVAPIPVPDPQKPWVWNDDTASWVPFE
jgi:hypothetical protein